MPRVVTYRAALCRNNRGSLPRLRGRPLWPIRCRVLEWSSPVLGAWPRPGEAKGRCVALAGEPKEGSPKFQTQPHRSARGEWHQASERAKRARGRMNQGIEACSDSGVRCGLRFLQAACRIALIARCGDSLVLPLGQPRIAGKVPKVCQPRPGALLAAQDLIDCACAAVDAPAIVNRVQFFHQVLRFEVWKTRVHGRIEQIDGLQVAAVVKAA